MTTPPTDYQPIACAQHERLEFGVLRKIPLDMKFVLHGEHKHEKVLPLDVNTRNGAEWLKFRREDGSETEIRLDAISGFFYADDRS
ncbi:MAG: transcriptional antiterminator, Rof [Sulfuricellaceae bacterium]